LLGKRLERERLHQIVDERINMEVHDLKAPLGTIVNVTELLLNESLSPEEQREFITMIGEAAKTSLKLVMNRLQLSSLEEGHYKLRRERMNPQELVLSAANQMAWMEHQRKSHIETNLGEGNRVVMVDRDLMLRVLTNLIDNAFKHTPALAQIKLNIENIPDGVRLHVADNGAGIPPELQPQVFDKFSRFNPNSKMSTGLGLAFCKAVVEAHGGSLSLQSDVDQGSTFTITLPAAEGDASLPA